MKYPADTTLVILSICLLKQMFSLDNTNSCLDTKLHCTGPVVQR